MFVIFLMQGYGIRALPSALFFSIVLAFPLAPLLIFWGIAMLIDWINPNSK